MVVCWGGHSINENEYLYARRVGNQLACASNICTGCGPGAMEAPMKGAGGRTRAAALQRQSLYWYDRARLIIAVAAEPPNLLVNELIIMPDIEKRLEAFVRIAHGNGWSPRGGHARVAVFEGNFNEPGHKDQVLPLILTGPKESADYFRVLDELVVHIAG